MALTELRVVVEAEGEQLVLRGVQHEGGVVAGPHARRAPAQRHAPRRQQRACGHHALLTHTSHLAPLLYTHIVKN